MSPKRRVLMSAGLLGLLSLVFAGISSTLWGVASFGIATLFCLIIGIFESDQTIERRWKWLQFGFGFFDDK